jgi:prepilin-type N-terminal cleavage/methylation domain-containing protein
MSKQELKQKGFTIIEVVLVLAIAALIFLMVFIALPALYSSQRDDARKKDASIISSNLASWLGNNRSGNTPTGEQLLAYGAVSANTETVDVVDNNTDDAVAAVDGTIHVYQGWKCGAVGGSGTGTDLTQMGLEQGTKRQYAIVTLLEAAGGTAFCIDS